MNRYKLLRGFKVNYIPGWDCHGLPIELKALQKLQSEAGDASDALSPVRTREVARFFAEDAIKHQQQDCARWGVLADWEDPEQWYRTMDKEYEAVQLGGLRWCGPGASARALMHACLGPAAQACSPTSWRAASSTAAASRCTGRPALGRRWRRRSWSTWTTT